MFKLRQETIDLLNDIETRIDPETEEDYEAQWKTFLDGKFTGRVFCPDRKKLSKPTVEINHVNINDACKDYDLMLYREMEEVARALDTNGALNVRANYGTGIMTALFGAEIFTMPYETDTLPTTRSCNDTSRIKEIISRGEPDLMGGFGRRVFEMGELYKEVFEKYPKIRRYVHVYHPDTQGPLDVCELLWGGEMFYAMYDEPELVHELQRLVTKTYTDFIDKWFEMYPCGNEMNPHWTFMHKGRIVLRNDSAMNLSPDAYTEFAKPYDAQLLRHFGGGIIHFCGRGNHYIKTMCEIPDLYGINMSQPHLNDTEEIYRNTVDKGLFIFDLNPEWAEKDADRPGGFHGRVYSCGERAWRKLPFRPRKDGTPS